MIVAAVIPTINPQNNRYSRLSVVYSATHHTLSLKSCPELLS
jgi:hypothetical protein